MKIKYNNKHRYKNMSNEKVLLLPEEKDRVICIFNDIDQVEYSKVQRIISDIKIDDARIAAHNANILKKYFNIDINFNTKAYNKPIKFVINTYGGDCYNGLGIYDLINNLTNSYEVQMEGNGIVASCGLIIFLAADIENRVCTKNTTFLLHQVSGGNVGKLKDMQETLIEETRINDKLFNIIKNSTNISEEQLKKNFNSKQDWYIDAYQAKELGIVNKII